MLNATMLTKRMTAAFTALALAATLTPALGVTQQAQADEGQLQAGQALTAQASSNQTTQATPELTAQASSNQAAQATPELTAQAGGGTNIYESTKANYNTDYYGSTLGEYSGWGYTYYKFTTSQASGVAYKVSVIATGSKEVRFSVLDEDYNLPWGGDSCVRAGEGRTLDLNLDLGKTYYVRIGENDWYQTDSVPFVLKVKKTVEKPQAPVVKSAKAGKAKLTFKYYETQYAKKYQIAIMQNGKGWKTYNNGARLSRTFKGLKRGKVYTVKVRAMRYFEGKWYAGAWSAIQKVKVRK